MDGFKQALSRNNSIEIGRATVPVALAGVPPASRTPLVGSPFGGLSRGADVFGQRPKTASETLALPEINRIVPAEIVGNLYGFDFRRKQPWKSLEIRGLHDVWIVPVRSIFAFCLISFTH
jgi:hypothetical protein